MSDVSEHDSDSDTEILKKKTTTSQQQQQKQDKTVPATPATTNTLAEIAGDSTTVQNQSM